MSEIAFRKPPLVEVSFGVRFKSPAEFSSAYIGRFWAQVAKDFSQAIDRPPIVDPQVAVESQLSLSPDGFAPRVWLVHRDQALLLQIQRDRFYVNWRKTGTDYPTFASLQPSFTKYFGEWCNFADASGLGQLEIKSCELSYTNFIDPDPRWGGLVEIGKVFMPLTGSQDIKAKRFALGWNGIYDFETNRVNSTIQTIRNVIDPSQHKMQFEIKAEPLVPTKAAENLEAWMSAANSDIVNAFLSLTTEWAQKELWERVK